MGAVAKILPAISLREQFTTRITDGYNRIYRDILAIGAMLVEAQGQLAHGEFLTMLERDLPFSRSTAYNYMREWTIANSEDLQPAGSLGDTPSVRLEIDRLTDGELAQGLADGKLYKGVSKSQVIDFRKAVRTAHVHRPQSLTRPAPARPEAPGARSYSELVYLLIEWRKGRGLSQLALDQHIGWSEGMTSKLEIPHMDDGRMASYDTLGEWMQGLGVGISLVPVQ